MRFAFCLAITLAAAPAFAKPVYNAPADVQAITQIEKRNATELNIQELVSSFAPDAVVYDLFHPGVYKGHAQINAGFGPQMPPVQSASADFPSLTILTDGAMGCAASQISLNLVMKNGTKMQMAMRQLDVLRKINGKWLIEQEHISFPANPKTGQSVMNTPQPSLSALDFATFPFAGPRVSGVAAKLQIKAWTKAFATAPTPAALVKLMGPEDNELIFDMFAPTPLQTRQGITTAYGPLFASVADVKVSFTDFTADSDGYMGAQIDTQILDIKMKDGSKLVWTLRQSDCLHYVDGRWYSVFDELSFPMDTKTGKAVMN